MLLRFSLLLVALSHTSGFKLPPIASTRHGTSTNAAQPIITTAATMAAAAVLTLAPATPAFAVRYSADDAVVMAQISAPKDKARQAEASADAEAKAQLKVAQEATAKAKAEAKAATAAQLKEAQAAVAAAKAAAKAEEKAAAAPTAPPRPSPAAATKPARHLQWVSPPRSASKRRPPTWASLSGRVPLT